MTPCDTVLHAVSHSAIDVTEITIRRVNEVHCLVSPRDVTRLAGVALRELGADLILMTADDRRSATGTFFVHYLFAHRTQNWFLHASVPLDGGRPLLGSLAALCYPASRFEREIRDLFGIVISGHPDPSPLVKHGFWPCDYYPLRKNAATAVFSDDGQPFPFTEVGGEGVYEIPVGPVHAGVIEPGHFRFSVMGETIINLRTRLYFTHKGTEKLFEGRQPADAVELAERISGDTSVGHALAYCQAVEAVTQVDVPPRAQLLRVILLELERLYNHIADVGAIVNDTGFAVAHAHCYRIRERLLRFNKRITGSRLLRGVLVPGGLGRELTLPPDLTSQVRAAVADFDDVVGICLKNTLVADRLEGTGVLHTDRARDHGALGYVGRASGLDIDVRRDHPFAAYAQLHFHVPVFTSGDVKARMSVRVDEVHESATLIDQAYRALPSGAIRASVPHPGAFTAAFGIVEGWRGRIVHWLMTSEDATLHRVKIVDPSFFNWPALSYALEGNIVPDFPLCNKSFNQSYSGNDL
ncbi:MAG: formate hydrogenase [Luteitalea sp.]|nr:formate hydrogenase [Luteitalea sp.]